MFCTAPRLTKMEALTCIFYAVCNEIKLDITLGVLQIIRIIRWEANNSAQLRLMKLLLNEYINIWYVTLLFTLAVKEEQLSFLYRLQSVGSSCKWAAQRLLEKPGESISRLKSSPDEQVNSKRKKKNKSSQHWPHYIQQKRIQRTLSSNNSNWNT